MAQQEDLTCDCGSDNCRELEVGDGLFQCKDCGAYFEADTVDLPRQNKHQRFDDDDRWG